MWTVAVKISYIIFCNNAAQRQRKLWNHLFPARGRVHLQHTILCTWEASSLTLDCTWTVVTSLAHTRSHTQSHGQMITRGCLTSALKLEFWVDEHSSLCCGTHVPVNTTRATVPALVRGETKTRSLVSTFCFQFFLFFSLVSRGCGCRTTDYTQSFSFVIFSVQAWSLTSGKRRSSYTHQAPKNPSLPSLFSTCFLTKQHAKHGFIIPTGKSLWQLLT